MNWKNAVQLFLKKKKRTLQSMSSGINQVRHPKSLPEVIFLHCVSERVLLGYANLVLQGIIPQRICLLYPFLPLLSIISMSHTEMHMQNRSILTRKILFVKVTCQNSNLASKVTTPRQEVYLVFFLM